MKRPYYVHTPRNIHGESLVSPHNSVCYEIRSTFTGSKTIRKIKDRSEADSAVKTLNDAHETEMAYAAGI